MTSRAMPNDLAAQDNDLYLKVVRDVLHQDQAAGPLRLPVVSDSMRPLLRAGDWIFVEAVTPALLPAGRHHCGATRRGIDYAPPGRPGRSRAGVRMAIIRACSIACYRPRKLWGASAPSSGAPSASICGRGTGRRRIVGSEESIGPSCACSRRDGPRPTDRPGGSPHWRPGRFR